LASSCPSKLEMVAFLPYLADLFNPQTPLLRTPLLHTPKSYVGEHILCASLSSILSSRHFPRPFPPLTGAPPKMHADLLKFYASCDLCTISRVCYVLKTIIILICSELCGVFSEIGCRGWDTPKMRGYFRVQVVYHGGCFTHQLRPYAVTSINIPRGGTRRHIARVTSVLSRFV